MLDVVFVASVFVFILAIFKSLFETNAFLKQLENAHHQIWQTLGSPRWRIHFGDTGFREAIKQIRSHKFASLNDPILEECYKAMKRAERTGYAAAAVAMGAVLFQAISVSY